MSKSVLISIQPKWCKLIFKFLGWDNGRPLYKKRLDLRKSKPVCNIPFKAYIYCPKDNTDRVPSRIWWKADKTGFQHILNGKVIGEFVCDYILSHCEMANADMAEQMSCVSREDILKYSNGKEVFGWHISDLVIYDKPKELREFYRKCEADKCEGCEHLKYQHINANELDYDCEFLNYNIPITRPPQSWCYVEGIA